MTELCVIPKILRFAVFGKYEFGNYLCDKREKVVGSKQLHFERPARKNGVTLRESEKKLRHRLLFATIERKIQFDFIKNKCMCACVRSRIASFRESVAAAAFVTAIGR